MRITDGTLAIYSDQPTEVLCVDFGNAHFRPEIDRGPLRNMLIGSLREDTVIWNARYTGIQLSGAGWQLFFVHREPVYADLVIAADGARSGIRKYLTRIQPVYSGITIMEGTIYNAVQQAPALWQLTAGGKVFAVDQGKIHYPECQGRQFAFVLYRH